MEEITVTTIMSFATLVMTYLFGLLSKKFKWIESQYIPYQNALIGIIAGITAYCIGLSNNLGTSIILCTISAFGAGGGYDLVKSTGKEG